MSTLRLRRDQYPHLHPLATRWNDNDMYGHVNNVAYYSYFDTAVNAFLIARGVLDPLHSEVIGVVAETGCQYFGAVSFPDALTIGIGVERLGTSSVTYRLGVFREQAQEPAAEGRFVHVYVDSVSRRPVPLPAAVRGFLEGLQLVLSVD